jgi:periplasmic copper chaperone A
MRCGYASRLSGSFAAAMAIGFATEAFAQEYRIRDLTIDHSWTRSTPPAAKTAAGYMTVTNNGSVDDRLIGVRTPAAKTAELHRSEQKDGVMQMRRQENGVPIPAGSTVELAPGGYHIMMTDLSAPFVRGKDVPLTLVFEKAGEVAVELRVEAPTGGQMHGPGH